MLCGFKEWCRRWHISEEISTRLSMSPNTHMPPHLRTPEFTISHKDLLQQYKITPNPKAVKIVPVPNEKVFDFLSSGKQVYVKFEGEEQPGFWTKVKVGFLDAQNNEISQRDAYKALENNLPVQARLEISLAAKEPDY